MQVKAVVAFSFFTAVVTAQSDSNSTLPELVSQIPECAIPCYSKAAGSAGCATTDFACLCGEGMSAFISSIVVCVIGKCSSSEIGDLERIATGVCSAVTSNPDPSEVASASAIVTSAVGAASPTTSSSSDDKNAAFRPETSFLGILGAAAAMLVI